MAHTMPISFFEMVTQETMLPLFKPALEHILNVYARRYTIFRFLAKFSNEIFYGLLYLLEKRYLEDYDSSFSEKLLGLKRFRVLPQQAKKKKKKNLAH